MTKQLQNRIRLLNTAALAVLLLLVAAYIYYLSASVVHVVIRKDVLQSTSEVRSEIADLESTYIARKQELATHAANETSLVAVTDKVFLTSAAPTLVVSR